MFVTTEGDFQTPEDVLLLTMEFEQLSGIHFEDQSPSLSPEETRGPGLGGRGAGREKGPPMVQVR